MWTKKTPPTISVPGNSSTKPSNVKTVQTTVKKSSPTSGNTSRTTPSVADKKSNTTVSAKPSTTVSTKFSTTAPTKPSTTTSVKSISTASAKSVTTASAKFETTASKKFGTNAPTKSSTTASAKSVTTASTKSGTTASQKPKGFAWGKPTTTETATSAKPSSTKPVAFEWTKPSTTLPTKHKTGVSETSTKPVSIPPTTTLPAKSTIPPSAPPTSPFLSQPYDLTRPSVPIASSSRSLAPSSTTRSVKSSTQPPGVTKPTTPSKTATTPRTSPLAQYTSRNDVSPSITSTQPGHLLSSTLSPYISFKRLRYEKFDDLDPIPSKIPDPVPAESKKEIVEMTNNFIIDQTILEVKYSRAGIFARREEKEIRYNMKKSRVDLLQKHPFFHRMMRSVVDQWVERHNRSKRYKPNERFKDTVVSRRRIQPNISNYFIEYAIKFNKRPWSYPGKNKIHTKIYDKVDFVDKPFVITEEKTEKEVERKTVKTLRRQSW